MNAKVQDQSAVPTAEVAPEEVQTLLRSELPNKSEAPEQPQIKEEVVIEEVSIDGMCGVY